jgi:predicted dehydrogenase
MNKPDRSAVVRNDHIDNSQAAQSGFTRRDFLGTTAAAAVTLWLPRSLRAQGTTASNDKLTVACVGVGSQGLRLMMDLLRLHEVQVVAVCDVNRGNSDYVEWGQNELRDKVRNLLNDPGWGANLTGPTAGREVARDVANAFYAKKHAAAGYRGCKAYEDFRELLDKESDVEAVTVSTPDHWHALIAIAAMREGKHVYGQKPMAHSAAEARRMAEVAQTSKRATQVSVFNSASPVSKFVIKALQDGIIGTVRKVDIWTSRASAYWKQGLATPTQIDPVPAGLNWDMWLGPAPSRPFNRIYQPFVWRAWYDFGCGAIGDMGEYGFDTITRALQLGAADRIYASSTDLYPECYPVASLVHFRFPEKAERPAVELTWYDGGLKPSRPAELDPSIEMGVDHEGILYTGDHGKLMTGYMADNPRLISPSGSVSSPMPALPETRDLFDPAHPELGESAAGALALHYREWVEACRGGAPAQANFTFEMPIVETLMLGNIAVRTQEVLEWDESAGRLTRGSSKAQALLDPPYREPWAKFARNS